MRSLIAVPLLLIACGPVSKAYVVKSPDEPLPAPRTVVFLGTGDAKDTAGISAVAFAFGEVLRTHGFEVKRFPKEDGSTPYGLELKGVVVDRCTEGGFQIGWINVFVVDSRRNEQVMAVGGEGFTEGCGPTPAYGNLFEQLAKLLSAAWAAPTSPTTASPQPSGVSL